MSLVDDICEEIRSQFKAAEHFKGLWLQANDELEGYKTKYVGSVLSIQDMYSMLYRCAGRFREYERIHRAKPDTVKADANAEIAKDIEDLMAKVGARL